MHKQLPALSENHRTIEVSQALEEGHEFFKQNSPSAVTLEYLQSVAKVRFSLSVFADQITSGIVDEDFMEICQDLCLDKDINMISQAESHGPILYLIRLIVRRYGIPMLKEKVEKYPWIVPEALLERDGVRNVR